MKEAIASFREASVCNYKTENIFAAARNLEVAASLARDLNGGEQDAIACYRECSGMYREHGQGDKAAESLVKAARVVQESDAEAAIELLLEAVDIYEEEEKEIYSNETFKTLISLQLRNDKAADARATLTRQAKVYDKLENRPSQWKSYLSIVVLSLHLNEEDAANSSSQEFLQVPGFFQSDEGRVLNRLMQAWEERDGEAVESIVSEQIFTFLDNQVAKIAKKLGEKVDHQDLL